MKAFILAAGLGTRLYPFTSDKPKALVELKGMTLLERAIRKVNELDVTEIVVNVHHFGSQIIEFLKEKENFHLPVTISDERDQLLDTGGAILKAHSLLGDHEPFLVYNVDILSSINLKELVAYHRDKGGIATLAVRKRETQRYLAFNSQMLLSGWRNVKTGEELMIRTDKNLQNFAFSGIQIVQPEIFPLITESGKFSIIQLYLRLAQSLEIYGYHDQSDLWMDLGKPEQLLAAEKMI
ncbi:MAG TPA: nucleotidyltransferase family protein [Prolixibacteraceae bacterium]|nr:nucleotidyltransferase family protein [Prolixibacteraceae bacterium]